MQVRKVWLIAGMVIAALALAATGSASQHGKSAGGTLIFGAEQGGGPDWCLNEAMSQDCGEFWNVVFETPVIRGAFILTPRFTYAPDLITGYKLQQHPQRVTYFIRKNARWSDHKPVTGRDFKFTWNVIMNPAYKDHTDTTGYEHIKSIVGNGKTVKVTYKTPYADWKDLFGYILPQHVLQGTNVVTVWNTCVCNPKTGAPIGDGPFLLSKYDAAAGITLTRNPAGWYGKAPKLNSIVFRYLTNTNTEIEQIRGGEVDAIYPQPQQALADLKSQSGLRIQSNQGTIMEHIDINQDVKGNPVAKNNWARQALMLSLDRGGTVNALFGQLKPGLKPINSVIYFPQQRGQYKADWAKWNYNPTKAASILASHGCSKGGDGIYRCGGTKLSFQFESTRGNKLRELAFTFFQDQAKKAGIELQNNFKPAGTLFGADLPNHDFDLAMYANLYSADPAGRVSQFECGGAANYTGYCNAAVTRMLHASDVTLNPKARTRLFNKIDAQLANDIPWIPLYTKPTYFVYKSNLRGMVDDPNAQGPSWNVESWAKG